MLHNATAHAAALTGKMKPNDKLFVVPGKDGGEPTSISHDAFVLEATVRDHKRGWCSKIMSQQEMNLVTQGRDVRLIPRIAIQQPNGNLRLIDNAAVGGQTDITEDANKL